MPDVFALRSDGETYKELDLKVTDLMGHMPKDASLKDIVYFSAQNTQLAGWWYTPDTKFVGGKGTAEIADLTLWIHATLVLSPKAFRILGELLQAYGELLPVRIGEDTYYIFNCLQFGQEDLENSTYSTAADALDRLQSLVFEGETSNHLLFKSKLDKCLNLFGNQRFKDLVEHYELTGIYFDEELVKLYA